MFCSTTEMERSADRLRLAPLGNFRFRLWPRTSTWTAKWISQSPPTAPANCFTETETGRSEVQLHSLWGPYPAILCFRLTSTETERRTLHSPSQTKACQALQC